MIRLGYNTNGFAHHRLCDAVDIIARIGFRSIAITLDVHHLDPYADDADDAARRTAARCRDLELLPVVETGARFLLDRSRKHMPTLVSADADERARRLDFLERSISVAAALGAPAVSLWSGRALECDVPGHIDERLDARLVAGLRPLCDRAAAEGIVIAFEPEPGMYIEGLAGFERIAGMLDHPAFRLTLDIGHAHLTEPDGAVAAVHRVRDHIANVHLEGMRTGAHEHLEPGDGDLDLLAATAALIDVGYDGPATLELSRHSHDAVAVATRAAAFFAPLGLL